MTIETPRLSIMSLTYPQLVIYLQANNLLERELGLAYTGRVVAVDVKEMVEKFTLPKIKESTKEDSLYYTFWIVIEKVTREIVAELGFKGPPNQQDEVEIGYGTMPQHQRKGFMTEAVAGLLAWAEKQIKVTTVLACINKSNQASLRIVEKNGFTFTEEKGEMQWWKKSVLS